MALGRRVAVVAEVRVIRTGFTPTPPGIPGGVYRFPWRKVKTAEPSPGWWNMPPVRKLHRREWFIEAECGHFMFRSGRDMEAPKRVRCKGCMPELEPDR